jgi:HK97 family phage portal protein
MGMSPVELTRIHWETTGKAGLATKNLYDNGMLSTLALKSTVSGANAKLMADATTKFENNTGTLNAGKVVPLPPNTELQSIPINLRDLQFLETIKAGYAFIAGMFGVPAHMVTGESPKFSNFEQSMLDFKFNTMANIISVYEYELELKLLGDSDMEDGYTIEFDDKMLMATDAKSRAEVDKIHFEMGVIDGDSIAIKEGYGTYEGGKTRYIASNNLTPIGQKNEEKSI